MSGPRNFSAPNGNPRNSRGYGGNQGTFGKPYPAYDTGYYGGYQPPPGAYYDPYAYGYPPQDPYSQGGAYGSAYGAPPVGPVAVDFVNISIVLSTVPMVEINPEDSEEDLAAVSEEEAILVEVRDEAIHPEVPIQNEEERLSEHLYKRTNSIHQKYAGSP